MAKYLFKAPEKKDISCFKIVKDTQRLYLELGLFFLPCRQVLFLVLSINLTEFSEGYA